MTIGELIENYCTRTGTTNPRFAELCGVSKGYISQLINGRNPKTNRPITPTIETYIKIAETMNITLDALFEQIDDAPILLKSSEHTIVEKDKPRMPITEEARIVSGWMDELPKEQREWIVDIVRAAVRKPQEG